MPSVRHLAYGAIELRADPALERNPAFELNHTFASGGSFNSEGIAAHFNHLCELPTGETYRHAFSRWERSLAAQGCVSLRGTINLRMLIGMAQPSLWETNIYLHPVYGTPWIPGSSSKGALRHYIERYLGRPEATRDEIKQGYVSQDVFNYLFGTTEGAGLVIIHDAWWVPDSAPAPVGRHLGKQHALVREVTTPHHVEFLESKGQTPATPFDSPRPIPQIATHGTFLVALQPRLPAYKFWAEYAASYLTHALRYEGVGARTPEYGQVTFAPNS